MKVLCIAQDFDRSAGGAELCLQTFSQLLVKNNHQCLVVTRQKYPFKKKVSNIRGITILRVPGDTYIHELKQLLYSYSPDICVSQKDWGMHAYRFFHMVPIPKVYFLRSTSYTENRVEQQFLRHYGIDLLVTNSLFDQQVLKKTIGLDSLLSYPLVDLPSYVVRSKRPRYITMINFRPEKGSALFVQLVKAFPSKQFLAIRGWQTIKHTKSQKKGNLLICGPYLDMRQVYKKTRLLLVPSVWPEPYGRIVLEAAVNGIPTIASAVGGLSEAVSEGGVLIDNYIDLSEWEKAINRFDTTTYYRLMAAKAVKRAHAYDMYHEYTVVEKAMEELVARSRGVVAKTKKRIDLFTNALTRKRMNIDSK